MDKDILKSDAESSFKALKEIKSSPVELMEVEPVVVLLQAIMQTKQDEKIALEIYKDATKFLKDFYNTGPAYHSKDDQIWLPRDLYESLCEVTLNALEVKGLMDFTPPQISEEARASGADRFR